MNLEIRKLKARDIFKFSKILKKLNDKNSLQNIIKTANEKNLEEKDHLSNLLKSGMASCPSAVYDEKRREEPGRFEST